MLSAIVLDTTPLGLLAKGQGHAEANACRQWIIDCYKGHYAIGEVSRQNNWRGKPPEKET